MQGKSTAEKINGGVIGAAAGLAASFGSAAFSGVAAKIAVDDALGVAFRTTATVTGSALGAGAVTYTFTGKVNVADSLLGAGAGRVAVTATTFGASLSELPMFGKSIIGLHTSIADFTFNKAIAGIAKGANKSDDSTDKTNTSSSTTANSNGGHEAGGNGSHDNDK